MIKFMKLDFDQLMTHFHDKTEVIMIKWWGNNQTETFDCEINHKWVIFMSQRGVIIELLIFEAIPTTLNPINGIIVNIGSGLVSFGWIFVVNRGSDFGYFQGLG